MTAGRVVELYLVTDTALCGGPDGVVETAVAAARGGVDMIQIRDHDASTRELCSLTTRVIDACRQIAPTSTPNATGARRVRVVVDDRLDVALAAGADGVHLGQSDLDPSAARRLADRIVGDGFHIGWSVSNVEQAAAAGRLAQGTIDLVGIGPFRATATKPDAACPLGLDGVSAVTAVARDAGLANVVIGGVKQPDVRALVNAGAQGVAVVSAICGQPDPLAATRALRRELDEALAGARSANDGRGAPERADHMGPA